LEAFEVLGELVEVFLGHRALDERLEELFVLLVAFERGADRGGLLKPGAVLGPKGGKKRVGPTPRCREVGGTAIPLAASKASGSALTL
jgi:hypothetical protein